MRYTFPQSGSIKPYVFAQPAFRYPMLKKQQKGSKLSTSLASKDKRAALAKKLSTAIVAKLRREFKQQQRRWQQAQLVRLTRGQR